MDRLGMKEAVAKRIIQVWLSSGVLVEDTYQCPVYRKAKTGLFAPENARPGEVF